MLHVVVVPLHDAVPAFQRQPAEVQLEEVVHEEHR